MAEKIERPFSVCLEAHKQTSKAVSKAVKMDAELIKHLEERIEIKARVLERERSQLSKKQYIAYKAFIDRLRFEVEVLKRK